MKLITFRILYWIIYLIYSYNNYLSDQKDEILRYKSVNQWISPEGWSINDILSNVNLKKIKSVYEKYFNFDEFYISNDKKEFE